MAQIKAHEFDGLVKRAGLSYKAFLVYGQDTGLISERAQVLSKKLNTDIDNDLNLIKLDYSEIVSDPGRLSDEVNAIALFGGSRLIWIKNAGNDKKLISALEVALETIDQEW